MQSGSTLEITYNTHIRAYEVQRINTSEMQEVTIDRPKKSETNGCPVLWKQKSYIPKRAINMRKLFAEF